MSFSGLNAQIQPYDLYVDTTALAPDTTYYLYLWSYDSTNVYAQPWTTSNHSVVLAYNSGLVHVYNGSGWDNCQAYVYDGYNWNLHIPYVYDGNWEILA